jgi:hypothetical protein
VPAYPVQFFLCTIGEVDFWVTISYSLQLMGKIILRLK